MLSALSSTLYNNQAQQTTIKDAPYMINGQPFLHFHCSTKQDMQNEEHSPFSPLLCTSGCWIFYSAMIADSHVLSVCDEFDFIAYCGISTYCLSLPIPSASSFAHVHCHCSSCPSHPSCCCTAAHPMPIIVINPSPL